MVEASAKAPVDAPQVRSEVGQLRSVLLHRPGLELERLTPGNMEELLFDELLWVEHAQLEHDAFAEVLRAGGVEVVYVEELLAEVLADRELAQATIETHATDNACGPSAGPSVREFLAGLAVGELVAHLIGGVTVDEVDAGDGLIAAAARSGATLLNPLPNTVFMRDSSAWIGQGVVLSPMNRLVRQRESSLLRTVVSNHPRFASAQIWFGEQHVNHYPATFEGGDLLVVGERGVAIGMSERTTPAGVEALAQRLFDNGVVDRILAVDLPKVRAAMHLDTIVTQVDVETFITYPSMTRHLACFEVTPSRSGPHVQSSPDLLEGLAWAAGLAAVQAIEPVLRSTSAQREQWNDANNTLAIRPGEVIAYERNVATNEILSDAGITVRTIPSYELPRGRGGPRCMSCPLDRAPI